MEDGYSWTCYGDMHYESWAALNGAKGLAMYGWEKGGGVYQDGPYSGASNYVFTAVGFKDAAFPADIFVELKIEFRDLSGRTISAQAERVQGTADWVQYSVSAMSPPETEIIRAVISYSGSPGHGGSFKWDDVELTSSPIQIQQVTPAPTNEPPKATAPGLSSPAPSGPRKLSSKEIRELRKP